MSRQNAGSRDESVLHLAVTDAPSGVPAEFRERVFAQFFRLEHHYRGDTQDRQGMGIGLSLGKHIITVHGGNIWYDTGAHGVGTRLALTLLSTS